jgi:hypothetical protein
MNGIVQESQSQSRQQQQGNGNEKLQRPGGGSGGGSGGLPRTLSAAALKNRFTKIANNVTVSNPVANVECVLFAHSCLVWAGAYGWSSLIELNALVLTNKPTTDLMNTGSSRRRFQGRGGCKRWLLRVGVL